MSKTITYKHYNVQVIEDVFYYRYNGVDQIKIIVCKGDDCWTRTHFDIHGNTLLTFTHETELGANKSAEGFMKSQAENGTSWKPQDLEPVKKMEDKRATIDPQHCWDIMNHLNRLLGSMHDELSEMAVSADVDMRDFNFQRGRVDAAAAFVREINNLLVEKSK